MSQAPGPHRLGLAVPPARVRDIAGPSGPFVSNKKSAGSEPYGTATVPSCSGLTSRSIRRVRCAASLANSGETITACFRRSRHWHASSTRESIRFRGRRSEFRYRISLGRRAVSANPAKSCGPEVMNSWVGVYSQEFGDKSQVRVVRLL